MLVAILGRGKLSWLAQEMIKDSVVIYDDTIDELPNIDECKEDTIFVSIGNNAFRQELFIRFKDRKIASLISEKAYVSSTADIRAGALISPFVTVHANVKLGLGCLIYSNSVIDVETELGNFCRVSPNVYIGNKVKIGNSCVINAGVTIIPGVEIGDNCYIAAGSVVTKSFGSNETIAGSPARSVVGNNELHSQE